MTDPPTPRISYAPGCAAWLVGVPLGLALGALGVSAWLVVRPQLLVDMLRETNPTGAWTVLIDGATFDRGDGWGSPRSWRWKLGDVTVIGALPHHPSIQIDGLSLAPPLPSLGVDGWVLTFPTLSASRVDLYFGKIEERATPPEPQPGGLTLVFSELFIDRFGLSMQRGLSPEVLVDAADVTLDGPFVTRPLGQELVGDLLLRVATVEVAGVRVDDVHPSRLRFEDHGLAVIASGHLGAAAVGITFDVNPLIGRARMDATAEVRHGTLAGLLESFLGPGEMHLLGQVQAKVTLSAGGDLGPGNLRGTAFVNVTNAGFARPESKRAAVVLAVTLAPFLSVEDAGDVITGDFHGDLSFTQRGITFDTVTYEAPHSIGELQGYVRGSAVSAKLHFRPRPNSGAIEWGFVLRGDVRKPKIALALPSVLRAWTPCEDSSNCPLVGGAPRSEPEDDAATEAELARAAKIAAAAVAKEARVDARDARQEDRQATRDDNQADRQDVRDEHAADRQDARDVREAEQTTRQEQRDAAND